MALADELRQRARATRAAGDWDGFSRLVAPVGARALDHVGVDDHARAAAELVRVCRPGGRVAMVTWANDGFAGELFKLTGAFLPPPPPGVDPPPPWGVDAHIAEVSGAAGATPSIERETVGFDFPSVENAVHHYADDFGPFVMARGVLEPQGRWHEFLTAFSELVTRFDAGDDGRATIRSEYLVITVDR